MGAISNNLVVEAIGYPNKFNLNLTSLNEQSYLRKERERELVVPF
jgi:hypothetical protein